jgi:hypothetical protein
MSHRLIRGGGWVDGWGKDMSMGWRVQVGGAAAVTAPPLYGDAGTVAGCRRGHAERIAGADVALCSVRVYRAAVGR